MERVTLNGLDALELLLRNRQELAAQREERLASAFEQLDELGVLPVVPLVEARREPSLLEQSEMRVAAQQSVLVTPVRSKPLLVDVLPVLHQILTVLSEDRVEAARLRALERAVLDKLLAKLT